jgi:hypothetical protein
LSAVFLIVSAACMPAAAGVSNGMTTQLGLPGQPPHPPPRPAPGPAAPDGGAPFPSCGPSTCPSLHFDLK